MQHFLQTASLSNAYKHCFYNCAGLKLAESSILSGTVLGWQRSQLHCLELASHGGRFSFWRAVHLPPVLWLAPSLIGRHSHGLAGLSEAVLIWDSWTKTAPSWSPLEFLEFLLHLWDKVGCCCDEMRCQRPCRGPWIWEIDVLIQMHAQMHAHGHTGTHTHAAVASAAF